MLDNSRSRLSRPLFSGEIYFQSELVAAIEVGYTRPASFLSGNRSTGPVMDAIL